MAFDVVLANSAARRLDETANFLQYVCCNSEFATALLVGVKTSIIKLGAKEGFHIVDHTVSDFVGETVYRIKLGRYKIVYKIDEPNNRYIVFLFMHESQDLDVSVIRDFESTN